MNMKGGIAGLMKQAQQMAAASFRAARKRCPNHRYRKIANR